MPNSHSKFMSVLKKLNIIMSIAIAASPHCLRNIHIIYHMFCEFGKIFILIHCSSHPRQDSNLSTLHLEMAVLPLHYIRGCFGRAPAPFGICPSTKSIDLRQASNMSCHSKKPNSLLIVVDLPMCLYQWTARSLAKC